MIDHVWTVVCSDAVIDSDSKNVSIHNVIEQIIVSVKPEPKGVLPIEFDIVTLWVRSDFDKPSVGHARISLLSPSGQKLKELEYDLNALADFERLRARQHFRGLPAPESGRYTFYVELKNEGEEEWHHVASVPLKVVFTPPETKAEEAKQD